MPEPYRRAFIGDFEKSQKDHPEWPVVIAEGDSWFSYADVIGQLDDPQDKGNPKFQRKWALLRLEKAGDEVMTILSGAQRSQLRKYFSRWKLDALLFWGGGNDIIGPDLLPLLRDFTPGATAQDLVQRSRFERRIPDPGLLPRAPRPDGRREADVQDLREFLRLHRPLEQGRRAPLRRHQNLRPLGEAQSEARNIPPPLQAEVIKLLIDNFATAIDQVAREPRGIGRLVRVETRDVVKGEWKDEIHPNRKGAMRVAGKFEGELKRMRVVE